MAIDMLDLLDYILGRTGPLGGPGDWNMSPLRVQALTQVNGCRGVQRVSWVVQKGNRPEVEFLSEGVLLRTLF